MKTICCIFLCFFSLSLYTPVLMAGQIDAPATRNFGDYRVVLTRLPDLMGSKYSIFRGKKKVFEKSDYGNYFYLGNYFDDQVKGNDPYSGTSITGNGIPNLLISEWTGGAHCCNYLSIFELGKTLRHITTVDAGSHGIRLVDFDGDGVVEIEFWDWPIDYLFTSFSESAQGRVVLKFQNGKYRVSTKLMNRPAPNVKFLGKRLGIIKSEFKEKIGVPHSLLKLMMDLSYTGHVDLAMKVPEMVWPSEKPGLPKFQADFKDALKQSKYWNEYSKKD